MKSLKPLAIALAGAGCILAVALAAANASEPLDRETVAAAAALRDRILAGSRAAEWVEEIVDTAGPRLAGSPGDAAGVEAGLRVMRAAGLANVRAEPVTVPVWQRGVETGEVTSPVSQKLVLTALGGSVATPEGGLEAEIVRVASLLELDLLGAAAKGKIVFIDRPTARTSDGSGYSQAVSVRADGPTRAARLGATGVLIRSIGTGGDRLPHTGGLSYKAGAPKIPAAALSAPDADVLTRLVRRGQPVRVRFTLTCRTLPDARSANVIGEVPGREKPGEIVLIGAHLDSWDLGTGAVDDGAGCGIVVEAARQIAALPKKPRRTVRVILFANEENGLAGGKAYAKDHAAELPLHVAAFESDFGQGPPLGFWWNAGPTAEARLKAIAAVLAPIAADGLTVTDHGGADLIPLLPSGIPSLGHLLDGTEYFDLHHTAHDTFDRIVPKILDRSTASAAVLAWILAEMPETLERIPEARRVIPTW